MEEEQVQILSLSRTTENLEGVFQLVSSSIYHHVTGEKSYSNNEGPLLKSHLTPS